MDQPDSLIDQRLQDTHHFDWYVPPELKWEDPNDKAERDARGEPIAAWRETPVLGQGEQVLLNALKEIYKANRRRGVLLLAAAGSGKTVLTYMCEHVLSDKSSRQQIFGDALPRLVLRWAKSNWPNVTTNGYKPKLLDLIEHDEAFQEFWKPKLDGSVGSTSARKLAEYALDNGRVAIIIDAWDELEADQKKLFRQIHDEIVGKKVLLVVSSRDYAINQEAVSFFKQDAFRRLRIQPFGPGLQDKFMTLALKPFVDDWRTQCLVGQGEDWNKQLGIPLVLRQLAVMINESKGANKTLPTFVSLSDLFVQTSNWMIDREFGEKDGNLEKRTIGGRVHSGERCRLILERALGAIAFELSVRGIWKEIAGANEIDPIEEKAKQRFIASRQAASNQRYIETQWNWAWDRMEEFEINNGSLQAEINKEVLSFVTRHVQEMRCARFLTHYCTEQDRKDALQHNGDESWSDIWKGVIKMKVEQSDVSRYHEAIRLLFKRPPAKQRLTQAAVDTEIPSQHRKRRQIHRRPTELMWIADEWIKAQSTLPGSALKGFDESLREYLGQQFLKCIHVEATKATALSLIEITNYVFLADPEHPSGVETAVKKAIQNKGGDFELGEFKRDPAKNPEMKEDKSLEAGPISVTKFGISKLSVSNQQFALFDDNYGGESSGYCKWFGDDQQPSVFVSWLDSFWYATFVEYGRRAVAKDERLIGQTEVIRDWRVCMPEENQFEYAYRAGSDGRFFFAFDGVGELIEVDESTLGEYAHFGQGRFGLAFATGPTVKVGDKEPNAYGLRLAGNHFKWMGTHLEWMQEWRYGSYWLIRGGSWFGGDAHCEAAFRRGGRLPTARADNHGLVLALSPLESRSQTSGRAKPAAGCT